jgi:hypothetical protein
MKYKKLIFGLLISFVLTSCDCWVTIDGKVIDSNSKEPIEKAFLEFTNIKCTEIVRATAQNVKTNCVFATDSIGIFFMNSDSYGLCPDNPVKIKIRKVGYKTKEMELNQGHLINDLIIELEKE